MEFEQRYTEDHEEWLQIVEKAEGGVYVLQGFMAYNPSAPPSSKRRHVRDQKVVERAVAKVRDEFGWGVLTAVTGPLTVGVAVFEGRTGEAIRYAGDDTGAVEGGWWLLLPVDYHGYFHDRQRCQFLVRECGRDVALYAREYAEKQSGEVTLEEFRYTVEYALVDGDIYVYNDHPDSPEIARALFEEGQRD